MAKNHVLCDRFILPILPVMSKSTITNCQTEINMNRILRFAYNQTSLFISLPFEIFTIPPKFISLHGVKHHETNVKHVLHLLHYIFSK